MTISLLPSHVGENQYDETDVITYLIKICFYVDIQLFSSFALQKLPCNGDK